MALVHFDQVVKKFGKTTALDHLNLTIGENRIYGLIGLNGSGKSTLLNLTTGLIVADQGKVETFNRDAAELTDVERCKLGNVPQNTRLLEWLTVREHLRYVAGFYRQWNQDLENRLLDLFDLEPKKKVGSLSPGNAQKLAIILAICHGPELLLMDEPASAMDPITRRKFFGMLFELLDQIGTVVISSHVLTDIEKVVDGIICIHKGRLVVMEDLDLLLERHACWTINKRETPLPTHFEEPYIIQQSHDGWGAKLFVDTREADSDAFKAKYGVGPKTTAVNLETLFPLLIEEQHS